MNKRLLLATSLLIAGCGSRELTESEKAAADLNKTRATFEKNVRDGQDRANAQAVGQAIQQGKSSP
jgi:hypothetical protein